MHGKFDPCINKKNINYVNFYAHWMALLTESTEFDILKSTFKSNKSILCIFFHSRQSFLSLALSSLRGAAASLSVMRSESPGFAVLQFLSCLLTILLLEDVLSER